MRKLLLLVGLAGTMAALSAFASFDGTVTMTGGQYESGNGGEFTAATTGLGTFTTFCIEDAEFFQLGGGYNYRINTGAVMGGGGLGGANAVDPNTGLAMDNISIGTAWLYSQFRSGGIVINSVASAGALQNAIWELEGELAYNPNDAYILAAKAALTLNDAGVQADSLGAYGVVALNLFNGPAATEVTAPDGTVYRLNQDMLGIVPEPTTMLAGALLLLPFGASTLRILRKTRTA